jgi:hypothetical protein
MIDKQSKIFSYTVGELIEVLKEYPKEMSVIVSGYENGIDALVLEREERND